TLLPIGLENGVWHLSRQFDVGHDALCYADAHCGHWLCAAVGSAMARLAAARLCVRTLESLPPTRSGLPARAGNAGESIAAHPKSPTNSTTPGRDDGYVGQYGIIR